MFDLPLALLLFGALALGAAVGYGGAYLYRRINRDDSDLGESFARHYADGIMHYIAGRRDEAIDQLTRAARLRTDLISLYLILGNLYREKGLFDRAIRVHSGLLGRQNLNRTDRAQVQASLGEDFRTAGLVERAREAFREALNSDSRNLQALRALSRFYIEEKNWKEALDLEEQIIRLDGARKSRPLAFIYNEMGREYLAQGEERLAHRNFQKAIAVDDRTYPAHIFLGDEFYRNGKIAKAAGHWERVVDLEPRHLHLVFDRLENAYEELDKPRALEELCRRVAERDTRDWRALVLLARIEASRSDDEAAYSRLLDAARVFPQSLTIQKELWQLTLRKGVSRKHVEDYLERVKDVNDFSDPFVCVTCRYRSLEYLWRCPQCYEWDTFTEEPPPSGSGEVGGAWPPRNQTAPLDH